MSPRQLLRRPLGLGGIALAAIILVVGGLLVMQKSQGPLTVQRTAFFGSTTTSSDPVVKAMAEAATDETFQGMSAMRVDTVAGAELGTPAERRLPRASELGAQYALSGNVGSNDSGINIAIRLEEVPSRTTLWAGGVEGEASQTKSLPVEAAAKAIDLLTCFKRRLRTLPRNHPQLLPLVAQVCSQVRLIDHKKSRRRKNSRKRCRCRQTPGQSGDAISLAVTLVPAARQEELIGQAEQALKRAEELDLHEPAILTAKRTPRLAAAHASRKTAGDPR